MPIKVGEPLPPATFFVIGANGPEPRTTDAFFKARRIVLFAVPGAFTPTCDQNHLPGYLKLAADMKGWGVDAVAVTGVNDVFVMQAWAKASGGEGVIDFLADGSGQFAKALGLDLDLTERGLGIRSQRYSMLVDDGIVTSLAIEDSPSKADVSGAEAMLAALRGQTPAPS